MSRPIVEGLFEFGSEPPRLIISRCGDCGALAFPARNRCQACSGGNLELAESPAQGIIYSWTVVRELGGPRPDFEPYVVAQVDLAPGLRVQGLVDTHPGGVFIGQPVCISLMTPPGPGFDPDVVTYCFALVAGDAA